MKYIFTFLMALCATVAFGQTTLLDFESATTWTDFDGGAVTTISNPYSNSDNNSANVGKMVKSADKTWGGSWTDLGTAIDFANNNTLSMKVYSPRANAKVLLKVENSSDNNINFEKQVTMTMANAWETLVFDYSTINTSNSYHKIILIFDNGTMGDGTANFTFYVDDVVLYQQGETCSDGVMNNGETAIDCGGPNCSPCITPPATAAPTPPARAAADVFSLYSDAYTTGPTFDAFDAGWCGSPSYTAVTIAGDNTLKKSKGCHGIDFKSDKQDLSAFTHLHFDFYTADTDLTGDVFNVKLVDFGGGSAEASSLQVNINGGTTPKLEANKWISVDVDITSLTAPVAGSLTRTDIAQFGITTTNSDNVWYDNIYLYKGTPLSVGELSKNDISFYPNPFSNHIEVRAAQAVEQVHIFDISGKKVLHATPNKAHFRLHTAHLNKGVYMMSLESAGQSSTAKLIK